MQQSLREFVAELQRRAAAAQAQPPAGHRFARGAPRQECRRVAPRIGSRRRAADARAERTALAPDDRVHIHSLHADGTVVEDYGKTVLVAIGPMKTVVQRSDVRETLGRAE